MYTYFRPSIVTLVLANTLSPAIASPITLDRVGNWELNLDNGSCNLLARFGSDDNEAIVHFIKFEPAESLELRLYGKNLNISNKIYPASIDFYPIGNPIKLNPDIGINAERPMIIMGNVRLDDWVSSYVGEPRPVISPGDEQRVTSFVVNVPNGKSFQFITGPMRAPMAALRNCTTELIKSWGYDPKIVSSLRSGPIPTTDPVKWVMAESYPFDMAQNHKSALVRFRVDVGPDGKVSGCNVLDNAGDPSFGKRTCAMIVRQARFHAALDAQGRPVKAYFMSSVRWIAP